MKLLMKSAGYPPLEMLYLYITRGCNMACKHCWINARPIAKAKDEVIFKKLKYAIYEAKELGLRALKITGGEPYARKGLLHELVKAASELKLYVAIETNGTFINEAEARFLKDHVAQVQISLDFPDERFDEFRGLKGAFRRAMRAMVSLREHGVAWTCMTAVNRSNINDIPAIAELVFTLGARGLKIDACLALGRAKELKDEGELLSFIDYIQLLKIILQLYKKYPGKIRTTAPWALIAPFEYPFRIAGVCPYKHLLSILPNGDIALCGIGITHSETVLGNIYKDNITKIWIEGEGCLKEIRSFTRSSFEGVCSKCMFREQCANVCPAYVYETAGTFFASYPICERLHKAGLFPEEYLLDEGKTSETEGKFLGLWAASRYLGISVDIVYKMLKRGELPGKKVEGRWRISLEELDRWLDEEIPQEELEKLSKRLQIDQQQMQESLEQASDQGFCNL